MIPTPYVMSNRDQYGIQPGAVQVCNSMILICVAESVFRKVLLIRMWRIVSSIFLSLICMIDFNMSFKRICLFEFTK